MAKKKKLNKDLSALSEQQTAQIGWTLQQWQEHPVIGLTPHRLHGLLTGAEQGNLSAMADLGADMEERDGHIFSELAKRKKSINGLPWTINPCKRADAKDKKIAEEVAVWIDEIPDFEMMLFDALDAIGHGYSCHEIVWHNVENIWLPERFEHHLSRHFMTPVDKPNQLRINDGSMHGAEFLACGWFNHFHKAKSGYIARSGLHRVLAWPFLFKNYGVRDIMEFLETYGLPTKLGKYSEGATDQEKMTLLRAVMSIGRNAGGIIPKGMDIDIQAATQGDTDNHMALIRWCEQTQSKIILGGTLLSQADGKSSTNAQSKTHENQFEILIESDAKQLARSINDSLIAHLMRVNYPEVDPRHYPVFYFDTSDTEDLKTFSKSLPKLVETGMQIPVEWAHKRAGIPLPKSGEQILTLQKVGLAANYYQSNLLQTRLAANSQQLPLPQQAIHLAVQDELKDAQDLTEKWMHDFIQQIQNGKTDAEILAMLSDINPHDDEIELQEKLTSLIFAAETLGRLSVSEEL